MTETCPLCGALLAADDGGRHRAFHSAHDLHAPECSVVAHAAAQRHTGAYLIPTPCTCGLTPPPIVRTDP